MAKTKEITDHEHLAFMGRCFTLTGELPTRESYRSWMKDHHPDLALGDHRRVDRVITTFRKGMTAPASDVRLEDVAPVAAILLERISVLLAGIMQETGTAARNEVLATTQLAAESLKARVEGLEDDATQLRDEIAMAKAREMELEAKLGEEGRAHEGEVASLQDEIGSLRDEMEALVSAHGAELERLAKSIDENQVQPLKAEVTNHARALDEAKREVAAIRLVAARADALERERGTLLERIDRLEGQVREFGDERREFIRELLRRPHLSEPADQDSDTEAAAD